MLGWSQFHARRARFQAGGVTVPCQEGMVPGRSQSDDLRTGDRVRSKEDRDDMRSDLHTVASVHVDPTL